jgi:hypothetical protein
MAALDTGMTALQLFDQSTARTLITAPVATLGVQLLDLPTEIFEHVIDYYIMQVGIIEFWHMRLVRGK